MPFLRKHGRSSTSVSLQIGESFASIPQAIAHRDLFSSLSELINIDTELLKPIAAKFNLSFNAFGEVSMDPAAQYYGSVTLSNPWNYWLEPSPISPYHGSVAFDILSGTIKSVYNTHRGLKGDDNIKVYPNYITGNTGETDRSSKFQ